MMFEKAGYRCQCGYSGRLELDHKIPAIRLAKAAASEADFIRAFHDPENLQALCRSCHILKTRGEQTRIPSPEVKRWRDFTNELR